MPVPTPSTGETQGNFMGRCVKFLMKEEPDRDQKQAVAICYSQWRGESIHSDFQRILKLFVKRYGFDGVLKFESFLKSNNIDPAKAYDPRVQFAESFSWVEPLISLYKTDKEAKYYLIRA